MKYSWFPLGSDVAIYSGTLCVRIARMHNPDPQSLQGSASAALEGAYLTFADGDLNGI
jgi:hypothetical protein